MLVPLGTLHSSPLKNTSPQGLCSLLYTRTLPKGPLTGESIHASATALPVFRGLPIGELCAVLLATPFSSHYSHHGPFNSGPQPGQRCSDISRHAELIACQVLSYSCHLLVCELTAQTQPYRCPPVRQVITLRHGGRRQLDTVYVSQLGLERDPGS